MFPCKPQIDSYIDDCFTKMILTENMDRLHKESINRVDMLQLSQSVPTIQNVDQFGGKCIIQIRRSSGENHTN